MLNCAHQCNRPALCCLAGCHRSFQTTRNYFKLRINSWALLVPLATKRMKACRAFLRPVANSRCLAMLALKYAGLDGDPTIGGTCGKPAINDEVFAGDESGA